MDKTKMKIDYSPTTTRINICLKETSGETYDQIRKQIYSDDMPVSTFSTMTAAYSNVY